MPRFLRVLFSLLAAAPLLAQGNELVFVGASISGSTDPYYLVAADTGALLETFPHQHTDNVRAAVWADHGANLFVARAPGGTPGTLPPCVSRVQWNGSTSTLSTFHPTPGACYGVDLDELRQRLWVLTGPASNTRELRCLDANPTSPGYGSMLAQTTSLSGTVREHFQLSASGNYAAVARSYLSVLGCLDVIDLDPSSPTYLQNVAPIVAGGGYGVGCAISPNDQYALLLCSSPSALVVVHIPTMMVLDFNAVQAGQQHFSIPLASAIGMALANNGTFAAVSGIGSGGWAGRIDLDYTTPSNTTFTQYLPGQLSNCQGVSVSPDDTRIALTTNDSVSGCSLLILDAAAGSVQHRTGLPGIAAGIATAWQRDPQFATYSPFGTGCAGSLGVPALNGAVGAKPVLGATFTLQVDHLPLGLAVVGFGASLTNFGTLPLPFDLGLIGMPGCTLLAAPEVSILVSSASSVGTASWNIPNSPSHFGFRFYNQALVLDPIANAAGFVVSNAAAGQLGY